MELFYYLSLSVQKLPISVFIFSIPHFNLKLSNVDIVKLFYEMERNLDGETDGTTRRHQLSNLTTYRRTTEKMFDN